MEAPDRNMKWILVVSVIMFFGSMYFYAYYYAILGGLYGSLSTRNVWYYLQIIEHLFFILTIGSSALWIAGFARRWTYIGSVCFFAISILLLFVEGLRGFF
ncbi:MAG TPA: hypothetical protein VMT42_00925 [candidate division Zixibacteria bacterium]|nr:hypothetical protein [candidate division Zixibacteria bacterium]